MNTGNALREEEGQVLVETALTLLLFFTFLMAIFEGGQLLQTQQTLTQAAREGARYAVLPLTQTSTLPTCLEVRDMVRTYLQASSIDVPASAIHVTRNYQYTGDPTVYSYIKVEYTFRWMVMSVFGAPDVSLSGDSAMRNETSPSLAGLPPNC
jgi:Flp pilus assembly protein TadG